MQSTPVDRPRARRGLTALLAALAVQSWLGGVGRAQDIETARDLAPALWLGPDEIAYPMLPHPFAFDGIDNDEDGCTDLEDADEIQALVAPHDHPGRRLEIQMLLQRLRDVRRRLANDEDVEDEVAKPAAGGCCCCRKRPVSEFKLCRHDADGNIACGPDAVLLVALDDQPGSAELGLKQNNGGPEGGRSAQIKYIQYWMYYPWDAGHLHDGEHATVFFSDGEIPRVHAVLGAGHLGSVANNLLVAAGKGPSSRVPFPDEIPPHIPVLSELGKHASAFDLNCNGRFDTGQDANDLPSGAWGTRDANHAIGKSSWARFEPWTSFDRRADGYLVEEQAGGSESRKRSWLRSCPEFSLGNSIITERLKHHQPPGRQPKTYRLVRANTVRRFFELASGARDERTVIESEEYRELLGLGANSPPPRTRADLQALRTWASRDGGCNTTPRPDVWNHCDFEAPVRDLKLNLFPRLGASLVFTEEGGNGKAGIALRLAGVGFIPDSSVELQALVDNLHFWGGSSVAEHNRSLLADGASGINEGRGLKLEVALFYNAFSTSFSGPYVGASWRARDYSYRRAYVVPEGQVGEGSSYAVLVERSGTNVNLEAGYSYRLPIRLPLRVRFGIAGPIWRSIKNPESQGELRYYQHPNPFETRVSFELGPMRLVRRPHPLRNGR